MLIQEGATARAGSGAGVFAGRLACLAGLLSIAGCTGGEKLPTVPASGTVTYNGNPLEGATVTLLPKGQAEGAEGAKGSAGQTDGQGRFSLQTYLGGSRSASGALPGDYTVSITKVDNLMDRLRPGGGGGAKMQEEAVAKGAPSGGGGPPGRGGGPGMGGQGIQAKSLIPEKYADAAKSELTATIGKSGNTDLKFELKD